MPFDPVLRERLQHLTREHFPQLIERNMFGGFGYFLNGHYSYGASEVLIVRVGPEAYQEALAQTHVRVMDITGRPMRGWVIVDAPGIADDDQLRSWLQRGVDFASTLPPKQV